MIKNVSPIAVWAGMIGVHSVFALPASPRL